MENINNKLLTQFKEDIQKKYGQKVLYAKDCQNLLLHLQAKTNREVSITTLKRFFGIINSPFAPGKYTLDTFAIYLNYEKWQDYILHLDKHANSTTQFETWEILKKQTLQITNTSLRSLKTKIGSDLADRPLREFADMKIERFLHSSKVATAFIAPDGYGKSTIVTNLTRKFFTGPDARYPDDIICLVEAGILFNLISQHPKVTKLYNLLHYDPKKSFSTVFRANPQLIKGRFVLIIDGLDELYKDPQRSDFFIDNLIKMISSYEKNEWFKLIITCSPIIWKRFSFVLQKNPFLKSLWFDVNFDGTIEEMINIPVLKSREIKSIMISNNFPISYDELSYYEPELPSLIRNPYLLNLFISSCQQGKIISQTELLYEFVQRRILAPPFSEENNRVINAFFQFCENGKKETFVNKEDLRPFFESNTSYNELILNGILYEYTVPNTYLSINTYVKFSNEVLFEFYLANKIIKENKLNINLIRRTISEYKSDPQLQGNLLRFVIKISFQHGDIQFLEKIISALSNDVNDSHALPLNSNYVLLANTIGVELRKNNKQSEALLPKYGKSIAGYAYYFESIFDFDSLILHSGGNLKYCVKDNLTAKETIYIHFMKFMQYFLADDHEKCKLEYEVFQMMEQPEVADHLNVGFYFAPQIIYQSVIEKRLNEGLLEKIHLVFDQIFEEASQLNTNFPNYEFVILFALNYAKMDKEIIKLADHIFTKYDMTGLQSSCLYQLILSIIARALLNTGKIQKAVELFDKVEFSEVPVNMKHYIKIRYDLIKVEFLIHEGNVQKALNKLEEIKSISYLLKFKYFYKNALELEIRVKEVIRSH